MEEWSRKLKLLHWTCIERADRTSPFICFESGDGDGDGESGGPEGGGGGEFGGGDTLEGGTDDSVGFDGGSTSDGNAGSAGDYDFGGSGGGGGTGDPGGGGTGEPGGGGTGEPGGGFGGGGPGDYGGGFGGGNVEQGLGGGQPDPSTPEVPDPNTPEVPDPNVPDPNTPGFAAMAFAPSPGKEKEDDDKESKESKDFREAVTLELMAREQQTTGREVQLPEIVVEANPSAPGPGPGGSPSGTSFDATGSGFGAGNSEAATGIEAGNTAYEGWEAGTAGGPGMEGQSIESSTGAPGGYGGADTGATGGGAPGGGSAAGGAGSDVAGLDTGGGAVGGGGVQDSQGGGGSGGTPDIFDVPMRSPTAKEREKELEKELEKEFQQPQPPPQQPLPPPPQFTPPAQARGGIMDAITNAIIGSAQAAPAPSTAQSPGVPKEYYGKDGPLTDPNKPQDRPSFDYLPGISDPREREGQQKDKDSPFGPQTAFNTFGFNPTVPQGYNAPPSISGIPTGAPPAGQQVATGPNAVTTRGFIAPHPSGQVTQGPPLGPPTAGKPTPDPTIFDSRSIQSQVPSPLVGLTPAPPTGKGNLQSRVGQGRTDPFGKDAQNPNIFDPNTFTPSVGMLMSGMRSMTPSPPWEQTGAQAFGPRAPTQASPQVAQAPQQEQLTREQLAILTNPNLTGVPPTQFSLPAPREARERERPENREPLVVGRAPPPTTIFDLPPPGKIEQGPFNPPTRTIDPTAAPPPAPPPVEVATPTPAPPAAPPPAAPPPAPAYAPDQQQGNPLAGGLPVDASGMPASPASSQTGFGGGTGAIIPAVLTAAQREMDRRKGRALTAQEKRDAITEALMRRDLNAPGVSDFDRLRLQP